MKEYIYYFSLIEKKFKIVIQAKNKLFADGLFAQKVAEMAQIDAIVFRKTDIVDDIQEYQDVEKTPMPS